MIKGITMAPDVVKKKYLFLTKLDIVSATFASGTLVNDSMSPAHVISANSDVLVRNC